MKAILVPSDQGEHMPSVLATAELLGRQFEGTLEGVALRPIHVEIVAPDPIVAVTFPPADWNDAEFVGKSRRLFDDHFVGKQGLRARWRAGPSIDDAGLGSLARVYDVVILGRPNNSGTGPRMTTLEGALFESGRPVLIAPPTPPTSLGENVVVSWNQSTEQARVTADALPLLKRAKNVTVLAVEGLQVPGPTAAQCCDWLAMHGVNAREMSMGNGGKKPGDVVLAEAKKLGADLIVKGAYTQSRLRQMIFGGATSHLLAHSTIPILMAH